MFSITIKDVQRLFIDVNTFDVISVWLMLAPLTLYW